MSTTSTFTSSSNPQASSQLLQLPPELRVKILRQLHKSDGPIIGAKTSLSGQVLRCCQCLYTEAYHVLYSENTVSIECISRSMLDTIMNCSVLGSTICVDATTKRMRFLGDKGSKRSPGRWRTPEEEEAEQAAEASARKVYESTTHILAREFDQFLLYIRYRDTADVWTACYAYQQVLRSKSVIIALQPANDSIIMRNGLDRSCRLLRCSKVDFSNKLGEHPEQLAASKAIIEGKDRPVDLITQWFRIDEQITQLTWSVDTQDDSRLGMLEDAYSDPLHKLADAVHNCDRVLFTKAWLELRKKAEAWMRRRKALHLAKAEEQRQIANEMERTAVNTAAQFMVALTKISDDIGTAQDGV